MSTISYSRSFQHIVTQRLRVDGDAFMPNLRTGSAITVHVDSATGQLMRGTCSARYKEAIAPLDAEAAATVANQWAAVTPVRFRYRGNLDDHEAPTPPLRLGFIAEDVAAAGLHDVVVTDADGHVDGLDLAGLVAVQAIVIRQLQSQLASVEARLQALESTTIVSHPQP